MTRKTTIIGGGVIGGGWAARFLLNGWDVAVFDPDPQAERKINEVLANARRAPALEGLIEDAVAKGARIVAGGERGDQGYFFQPTALADVPLEALAMNEEPFGPLALIRTFATEDEAMVQANRLPYGLAAFLFSEDGRRINRVADALESGMVGVNGFAISSHDMPFGGIKESGFGSESGPEGLDGYLVTKAIHVY